VHIVRCSSFSSPLFSSLKKTNNCSIIKTMAKPVYLPVWQVALSSHHLSLRALSRATGVSHPYLGQILSGKVIPSEEIRRRVLAYFTEYRSEDLFPLSSSLSSSSSLSHSLLTTQNSKLVPSPSAPNPLLTFTTHNSELKTLPLPSLTQNSSLITQNSPLPPCKRCRSPHIIKKGFSNGVSGGRDQRYQCKYCGCVFLNNGALLNGRFPLELAAVVMERFFSGESLDSTRTSLDASHGVSLTVAALEKIIYRFCRKAVDLADEFMPDLYPRWLLESTLIPGARTACVLDVLDPETGYLIASDVIPGDYVEKERETVVQKALRLTGLTPEKIDLGPEYLELYMEADDEEYEDDDAASYSEYTASQQAHYEHYVKSRAVRTIILSRRLNFDSLTNMRLISSAWRIQYNFGFPFNLPIPSNSVSSSSNCSNVGSSNASSSNSASLNANPSQWSPFHSWQDIINAPSSSFAIF
jgi:transcriptional regulator with XRE-family HTH domain